MSKMLTVQYDPLNGMAVPDGAAMAKARAVVALFHSQNTTDHTVVIGTELFIYAFRTLVKQGAIKPTEIRFEFNREFLTIGVNGRVTPYPEGFGDYGLNMLMAL